MENKKRNLGEFSKVPMDSNPLPSTKEDLHWMLAALTRHKLVDLLAELGSQYPAIAQEIRNVASADPALRKLFVRGLAWNTTSETLCAAFEVHGEIEEGAVIIDKVTVKSRGYGFITYKDMESAHEALKAPSKMIDGRIAVCNLASEGLSSTTSATDQAQRKLFIGGLSPETTSEMLLNFFGRHGEIEEGSVVCNKETNKSHGFGFVTYKTVEAAKKALDDQQKMLGGTYIIVKLADPKSKVMQPKLPPLVVPVPMALTATYPQSHNIHSSSGAPVGYTYPQQMATYPSTTYSSPPVDAAAYSAQPESLYPQFALEGDPPTTQTAIGGYPYYMPK